jgi:hypothetical protein
MGREATHFCRASAFRFEPLEALFCFATQPGLVVPAGHRAAEIRPLPSALLVHRAHWRCSALTHMVGALPKQGPAQA